MAKVNPTTPGQRGDQHGERCKPRCDPTREVPQPPRICQVVVHNPPMLDVYHHDADCENGNHRDQLGDQDDERRKYAIRQSRGYAVTAIVSSTGVTSQ